jgi:hypothetical protein
MRINLILLAVLTCLAVPLRSQNDAPLHVRALLVVASNQPGESDSRLAPYEPTLRRILRFETYRLAGEDGASLSAPGSAELSLGRGHQLQLEADRNEGRASRVRVRWQESGRSLINTGLALRPGVPVVLGGPSTGKGGEVWAVIIIAGS